MSQDNTRTKVFKKHHHSFVEARVANSKVANSKVTYKKVAFGREM